MSIPTRFYKLTKRQTQEIKGDWRSQQKWQRGIVESFMQPLTVRDVIRTLKHEGALLTVTRDDLRALVDIVTNDPDIADTRLPAFLGTPERDKLIDRMLAERGRDD
jgi:hypothetical protein